METEDTMKKFLQKQPRNLTMARHTLGIHQLRIMARTVEALQPFMSFKVDHAKKKDDMCVTIKVSELVVGNNVKPLREALEGLMKKTVRIMHYIEDEAVFLEVGTTLIQAYEYKHGSSDVKIQISGHLLPQIIDLARGYTKYSLDVAFKTSSANTFKLYQYFSSFRDKNIIQCNVDTLRHWLQIDDKYKLPSQIKKWILEPAQKELRDKADVWFEFFERITQGRKMIGWRFRIYTRDLPKFEKEPEKNKAKERDPADQKLIDKLITKYKLSEDQAIKLVDKADRKALNKEIYDLQFIINTGNINNIGGFCVKIFSTKLNIKL